MRGCSRHRWQAVDEQRDMLASAKSKMGAQHAALLAVGAPPRGAGAAQAVS